MFCVLNCGKLKSLKSFRFYQLLYSQYHTHYPELLSQHVWLIKPQWVKDSLVLRQVH